MPAERDSFGLCLVGSDIYIVGGHDDSEEATSTTYRYSTETNTCYTCTYARGTALSQRVRA
jgi:DUF1680 family protein